MIRWKRLDTTHAHGPQQVATCAPWPCPLLALDGWSMRCRPGRRTCPPGGAPRPGKAAAKHTKLARQAGRRQLERRDPRRAAAHVRSVALTIFALASPTSEAAAAFLAQQYARKRVPVVGAEALRPLVEEWYIEASVEAIVALTDPVTHRHKCVFARAQRFLAEYHCFSWVEQQNIAKGLAPLSESVHSTYVDAWAAQRHASGRSVEPSAPTRSGKQPQKQVARWRQTTGRARAREWGATRWASREGMPAKAVSIDRTLQHPSFGVMKRDVRFAHYPYLRAPSKTSPSAAVVKQQASHDTNSYRKGPKVLHHVRRQVPGPQL